MPRGERDRDESRAHAELEYARVRYPTRVRLESVEHVRVGDRRVQRHPVVEERGPGVAVGVGLDRVAVRERMVEIVGHAGATFIARSRDVQRISVSGLLAWGRDRGAVIMLPVPGAGSRFNEWSPRRRVCHRGTAPIARSGCAPPPC